MGGRWVDRGVLEMSDRTQPNSGVPILPSGMTNEVFYKEQAEYWRGIADQNKARIHALEGQLQVAQELFAIVVNPQDHPNTSVQHLWAQCVEAECKIRDLLKDGAK
jgi:hypothetical protein